MSEIHDYDQIMNSEARAGQRSSESQGKISSGYRDKNSTADRALDILSLFTIERRRLSAPEVSAELGVARSTAYRYLLTLSSANYVEEDPSGGFRLGGKVFELARLARLSYGLSDVSRPFLRHLAESTGETALLTKRSGSRVVCIEREETLDHRARLSYERGSVLPSNAGASAEVLFAWLEPPKARELMSADTLVEYTYSTLTDVDAMLARFAEIRRNGYALSRGELDPLAIGIAAPIFDEHGLVAAGISIVGVINRVPATREQELIDAVRGAAQTITEKFALASQ